MMTIEQMEAELQSVGACFATSTAKFVSPNDPRGVSPAYHIHPDARHPHEKDIVRVSSQRQLADWVLTRKAANRAKPAQAERLWLAYRSRWMR